MSNERAIGEVLRGAAVCVVATAGAIAGPALAVCAIGCGKGARRLLGFGFAGSSGGADQAAAIFVHNARLAGATLLCAYARPRLEGPARCGVDALLATLLTLNAGAVGVALGAYGAHLVAATAMHLPVEFTGLSLAAGAYVAARRGPLGVPVLLIVAALTAWFLAVAAGLEAYATVEGLR